MFRRTIVTATLLATILFATTAFATELEGKIQSVDAAERTVTLDNGTKLWLDESVSAEGLAEGAEVTVSFEDRDGKNVATSVQVK